MPTSYPLCLTRYLPAISICLFTAACTQPAVAQGGLESTIRPSASLPVLPRFIPQQPQPDFILPPVAVHPIRRPGSDTVIHIKRIGVYGNRVLPEAQLQALTHPYENRDLTVADLEELRQALTKLYQDQGYINSGAIIPEHALNHGDLRINIIEGRLNEVRVKGQGRLRAGYIQNRLLGNPEQAFNLQALQDRFQVLLSDPLVSRMNGRILPGANSGQSILDVEVVPSKPYRLSVFGDNYRPPSIGANAFGLTGSLLSPLGFGEILDFTYITSAGSNRYAGGLTIPVTDNGLVADFHFDESDAAVIEAPVKQLDVTSTVHSLEGGISQLFVNTLRQRLNVGLILAVRENRTHILGQPFSLVAGESTERTQATVWRVYQDYRQRWDNHALAARSTFSIGMNALGATPAYSDYPSSEFFVWLGQAQYAVRLADNNAQLVFRGNTQFTDRPLLPLEKIAVGGATSVRGYRNNYLVQDNGFSLNAELHYPVLDYTLKGTAGRLELVPFMDYGAAWDVKTSWQPSPKTLDLWSVGIGLQWQHQPLMVDFFYGYALVNKPPRPLPATFDSLQDNGLYFQIRADIF
ncbi:MAG: BamA/TamA family outer membrane protein [Methylococcales bacterium]|nr:BamA/TamA family outer membrane protein [Methylococcales bacterium]